MCIIFIYLNNNPSDNGYKLILANNRDESYIRPTKSANYIGSKPSIIAGLDLTEGRQGGTWLGASENGKIASLLNQMKNEVNPDSKSRGFLVMNYLMNGLSSQDYMNQIKNSGIIYDSFNLVALEQVLTKSPGEKEKLRYQLSYMSNLDNTVKILEPGVHGFSNTHINTPLRKVEEGKDKFKDTLDNIGKTIDNEEEIIEKLLEFMESTEEYFPDEVLSNNGKKYPEQALPLLSKIFVTTPHYGTRTTTLILVDSKDRMVFKERNVKDSTKSPIEWDENSYTLHLKQ